MAAIVSVAALMTTDTWQLKDWGGWQMVFVETVKQYGVFFFLSVFFQDATKTSGKIMCSFLF